MSKYHNNIKARYLSNIEDILPKSRSAKIRRNLPCPTTPLSFQAVHSTIVDILELTTQDGITRTADILGGLSVIKEEFTAASGNLPDGLRKNLASYSHEYTSG